MIAAPEADVALDACPDWVMANARGAGYYRFLLAPAALARLAAHVAQLDLAERIALGNALRTALARARSSPTRRPDRRLPRARGPRGSP